MFFMDRYNIEVPDLSKIKLPAYNIQVEVLIGHLWFYTGQKITLDKLRTYFTTNAIATLLADNYIKIIR